MATILDIAKHAGVSKTLVSRVLNDQKGVSQEARERILDAIKELNYRPNALARSLVLQKTHTIGAIFDTLCSSFFFDFMDEIQNTAEKAGYSILFCSGRNNAEIKHRYVDFFTQGRCDGLIIYGSFLTDDDLIRELAAENFPFVLIENEIPGLDINNVLVDNYGGAYEATRHLIQSGFREIVHFSGDMNHKISLERLNGFVRSMQDEGRPIHGHTIVYSGFTEQSGYESMRSLLAGGNLPDAIFFGADLTAFGAIRALREAGLDVPRDIAVAGFDDDKPESRDMLFPPLTTVRQPLREIGKTSMELLIQNMANPALPKQRLVLKTELVVRDSSKASR